MATVLVLSGSLLVGCARGPRLTMTGLTPSLSWGEREADDSTSESAGAEVASVKANVATAPDTALSSDQILSSDADSGEVSGFAVIESGALGEPITPSSEETSTDIDGHLETEELTTQAQPFPEDEPELRIQELKAALSADAGRYAREQEQAVSEHPLRVRAESLTLRAVDLFRRGDLIGARRAAQQAVEISETGRLDFLPTEDRPSNVLSQIDAAINRQSAGRAELASAVTNSIEVPDDIGTATLELPIPDSVAFAPQVPLNFPVDLPVKVAANRPVRLQQQAAMEQLTENAESSADHSAAMLSAAIEPPVDTSSESLAVPQPRIRGLTEHWEDTAQLHADATESQAPAPPTLEDLEPFPSVRSVPAFVTELPEEMQTPIPPMFSLDSLLWGCGALCAIVGITGIGLTLRRMLTFRRA